MTVSTFFKLQMQSREYSQYEVLIVMLQELVLHNASGSADKLCYVMCILDKRKINAQLFELIDYP